MERGVGDMAILKDKLLLDTSYLTECQNIKFKFSRERLKRKTVKRKRR